MELKCNFAFVFLTLSMYKAIDIYRNKLTLMGISFPDLATFNSVANAIGSNMYEGFESTVDIMDS